MPLPTLPEKNSTDWYGHYTGLDFAARAAGTIYAADPVYGLPTDGTSDGYTALTAAARDAQAAGKDLILPNYPVKVSAPITWDLGKGSLYGSGRAAALDFTAVTATGFVLTVNNGARGDHAAQSNRVARFLLQGPTSSSTTVGGMFVGDTAGGIDQGAVEHLTIDGFRDALEFGTNTWAMDFRKVGIRHYQRHGIYMAAGRTSSGELQSFYGCTIYNSGSSAFAGLRVNGGLEAAFYGCRFDYTTLPAYIEQGRIAFYGGHFEDDNDQNMVQIAQGASGQTAPVQVDFHSVQFAPTGTKSAREIVYVNSSSGGAVGVNFFGGQVVYRVGNEVLFNDASGHSITPGKYGIKYISNSGSTITAA